MACHFQTLSYVGVQRRVHGVHVQWICIPSFDVHNFIFSFLLMIRIFNCFCRIFYVCNAQPSVPWGFVHGFVHSTVTSLYMGKRSFQINVLIRVNLWTVSIFCHIRFGGDLQWTSTLPVNSCLYHLKRWIHFVYLCCSIAEATLCMCLVVFFIAISNFVTIFFCCCDYCCCHSLFSVIR